VAGPIADAAFVTEQYGKTRPDEVESPELGRHAFIWQQGTLVGGGRTPVPFLTRLQIANVNTAARGINDHEVIVGFTDSGVGFVGSDARGFELLVPAQRRCCGNQRRL